MIAPLPTPSLGDNRNALPRRTSPLCRSGVLAILAALAGAATATIGDAVPVAADPVRIEASRQGEAARIVLGWPAPIAFTSELSDGQLILRFERPLEANLGLLRNVRGFTSRPVLQDDGRTLVLSLRPGVSGLAVPAGDTVVLELRRSAAKQSHQTPESDVVDAAPAADADAVPAILAVAVRTGQHRGFSRIVFDWPEPAGYTLERTDNRLNVLFDRWGRIDARAFSRPYLRYIHGGSVDETAGGTRVSLQIAAGAPVRDAQEGPMLVIDVLAPPKLPPKPPAQATAQPSALPGPGAAAPALEGTAQAHPAASAAPAPQEASPGTPGAADLPARPPAGTPGPAQERPEAQAAVPVAPPEKSANSPAEPANATSSAAASGAPPTVTGAVSVSVDGMRFSWSQPVAAVLFRRGETMWCVFDRPLRQDLLPTNGAASGVVPPFLRSLERLPHPQATVLRLTPGPGEDLRLVPEGTAWRLRAGAEMPPASSIELAQEMTPDQRTRLLLRTQDPPPPLALQDPDVGDTLLVVPLARPVGIPRGFNSPRVRLLPSAQGVAIEPLADGIRVRSTMAGVEIGHWAGLALTPPASALQDAGNVRDAPPSRILEPGGWNASSAADFAQRRQALERALVDAPAVQREPHRLRLAQFLLGQNFAAEVLGVLTIAAEERPALAGEQPFLIMRGAARLLAGKSAAALDDLRRADHGETTESGMWLAAARAAAGEAPGSLRAPDDWLPLVRSYPQPLQAAILPKLAEAALAAGALQTAQRLLDTARPLVPDAEAVAEIGYLEGLRRQAADDPAGALALWEQVAKGNSRRSRARAALARTLLLLRQGQMSTDDAITELDPLRFVWRGDETEFRVLRELGRLQLQAQDYPAALRTLRQAAGDFPNMPEVAEVAREMARAFEKLYLDGAADQLPPVTALALWDEFAELTPPGDKGAEMTRRMAERMVRLDLLERAAHLLDGLLAATAAPAERAAVGARIAEIRVADNTPQAALDALRASAGPGLPADLQRRRALVQARALVGLNRGEEAAAVIQGDASPEAELVRAQAARARGDWEEAAAALRRILESPGADQTAAALDDRQARDILELAVALTFAGSDPQLAELDERYRGAMAATPLRDTFRLIAGTVPPPTADPAALKELVEKAIAYRRALSTGGSAPVPR